MKNGESGVLSPGRQPNAHPLAGGSKKYRALVVPEKQGSGEAQCIVEWVNCPPPPPLWGGCQVPLPTLSCLLPITA